MSVEEEETVLDAIAEEENENDDSEAFSESRPGSKDSKDAVKSSDEQNEGRGAHRRATWNREVSGESGEAEEDDWSESSENASEDASQDEEQKDDPPDLEIIREEPEGLEALRQEYFKKELKKEEEGGEDADGSGLEDSSSESYSDEEGPPEPTEAEAEVQFNEEDRAAAPDDDYEESLKRRTAMLDALEKQRLFRDCTRDFIQSLLDRSTRQCLAPNEALQIKDGGSLYVVETGALRLQVGSERSSMSCSVLGCGGTVNGAGFLRLHSEANAFRPRRISFKPVENPRSTRANGYDVQGYNGRAPYIYSDFRGGIKKEDYSGPDDTRICFFNTCPYACPSKSQFSRGTWLPFTARGGDPGEHPAQAGTSCLPGGGATVLALPPMQKILEMLGKTKSESADLSPSKIGPFRENCESVAFVWRELMSKFVAGVFPGAPVEAIYGMAECGEHITVPKGGNVVSEGEIGEAGDSIVLILDGVTTVLKKVRVVKGVPQMETIGRLRAGAIVGDISLIGGEIPRSATVRAKTDVEAVRFPSRALLFSIARFPGILEGCTERLMDAAECLKERLLTRTEVASSLNLFNGCDLGFVNDVANGGERRLLFAGDTVVMEGSTVGTLFVLEHGKCTVEVSGIGTVADVLQGNCFGERTLLGISDKANATVRVLTPFALVLAIPRQVLQKALDEHPAEQAHFEQLKTSPQEGRIAGSKVRHVELFRPCGFGFLESLNQSVTFCTYLHGQTICVEGDVEPDPRMFVLTGGFIVAEKGGRPLARMSPGATFGELAMLGLSKERPVTIRAVTLCFVMSIPSSIFFKALDQFPEEKVRFEQRSETKGPARVSWPCLRGESSRLLYLLDLYAEKASCKRGDRRLNQYPFNEAAVLVLEGEVSVINDEGEEVAVLTTGACFNERILVGARAKQTEFLMPLTHCEVRILNRETWGKVMAEFPHDLDKVRRTILLYMAERAEQRLGYEPGTVALLKEKTAFFSSVSDSFAKEALRLSETRIVEPDTDIVSNDLWSKGDQVMLEDLYIILQGKATSYNPHVGKRKINPGEAIGEGVFVGASSLYPHSVTTENLCLVQVLKRSVIFEAMRKHSEEDRQLLEQLEREVQPLTLAHLQKRLIQSSAFRDSDPMFVSQLARSPDIVLFAPGHIIMAQGEECVLGKSQFFMVLAGRVRAEGAVGTLFGTISPGQVFGEVGAFGMTKARSATARAWKEGMVCCLRFDGNVITDVLESCPQARDVLSKAWTALESKNAETELKRREWIKECAIPALSQTQILAGCPVDFLHSLAVLLKEQVFEAGSYIQETGEACNQMMIMLQGAARIQSKTGALIGPLNKGAVFNEINALGLFKYCMASVRATTTCRMLVLPDSSLKQVLQSGVAKDEGIAEAFQFLLETRHEQVSRGMPICGLDVSAEIDDVRVRAIALLSERIDLQPGEEWFPMSAEDPAGGAYIGMLVSGSAMVEMGDEGHCVMQLTSGSIFPEDLAAAYGAVARAETYCEAYRIRKMDFQIAVGSNTAPSNNWFWRFKMKEKAVSQKILKRLRSVQGLLDLSIPNSKDTEIKAWKQRRRQSFSDAQEKKLQDDDTKSPQLPLLNATANMDMGTVSSRSAGLLGDIAQKPGLMAYSVLQLPKLPKVREGSGSMMHSRSDTKLSQMSHRSDNSH
mmetsp:Transcript_47864/g.86344  ORF Transcript_47864/g.86344 Transcript_47864/m.86344 type:complete len:1659 (-) Transcript_47864:128-5104(-)